MAGSGWGEDDARGNWHANQDFDLRNLKVQNGEKLPPAWQLSQNIKYLQETFGKTCITYAPLKTRIKKVPKSAQQKVSEGEWMSLQRDPALSASGKRKT